MISYDSDRFGFEERFSIFFDSDRWTCISHPEPTYHTIFVGIKEVRVRNPLLVDRILFIGDKDRLLNLVKLKYPEAYDYVTLRIRNFEIGKQSSSSISPLAESVWQTTQDTRTCYRNAYSQIAKANPSKDYSKVINELDSYLETDDRSRDIDVHSLSLADRFWSLFKN